MFSLRGKDRSWSSIEISSNVAARSTINTPEY